VYPPAPLITCHGELRGALQPWVGRDWLVVVQSRLTFAFSKKLENLAAAIALHVGYFNFCWRMRENEGAAIGSRQRCRRASLIRSGASTICTIMSWGARLAPGKLSYFVRQGPILP
jgi:hypothetical protein